jgi:hypothetical protein
MKKPKHITTTIDMVGPVAELFLAKFNQLVELCETMKEQNENNTKEINQLNQKIDALQEPKHYSIQDLCRIYNVSPNTLAKYINLGLLNSCSVGQKVWFTREQIEDFNRRTDSRYKDNMNECGLDFQKNLNYS